MKFYSYFLLGAVILNGKLLVLCNAEDFTGKLFERLGNGEAGNSTVRVENLEELASAILDGHYLSDAKSRCKEQDCSDQCTQLTSLPAGTTVTPKMFKENCPQILYSLTQDCVKSSFPAPDHLLSSNTTSKPQPFAVWGYGFLFVTLINLCSLAGICVLPLMKKAFYSTLLMFLIALAVGSLSANGVLVLIPETFEIMDRENYVWRACCILGGIYLFFVTERILKMVTNRYATSGGLCNHGDDKEEHVAGTIPITTFIDIDRTEPEDIQFKISDQSEAAHEALLADKPASNGDVNGAPMAANGGSPANRLVKDGSSPNHSHKKPVGTVAWMIIFGDAFHNFIDGLSIGAAFSESTLLGISICIAVLCEELPHELGDFAILLNAGMSKKRALLFNFLSACTCYVGLVIGISLSEVTHATPWILGLAGGMFLYIALADMMPEMNYAAEERNDQPLKVFLIQNLGLLSGFIIIFFVSRYGGNINLN